MHTEKRKTLASAVNQIPEIACEISIMQKDFQTGEINKLQALFRSDQIYIWIWCKTNGFSPSLSSLSVWLHKKTRINRTLCIHKIADVEKYLCFVLSLSLFQMYMLICLNSVAGTVLYTLNHGAHDHNYAQFAIAFHVYMRFIPLYFNFNFVFFLFSRKYGIHFVRIHLVWFILFWCAIVSCTTMLNNLGDAIITYSALLELNWNL